MQRNCHHNDARRVTNSKRPVQSALHLTHRTFAIDHGASKRCLSESGNRSFWKERRVENLELLWIDFATPRDRRFQSAKTLKSRARFDKNGERVGEKREQANPHCKRFAS